MKVTVKTLQQTNFNLEIEPSETIANVKQKISELEPKASPIEKQKLIHSGKILVNEKSVEECGIKEGDFLVLMISSTISATKPKESSNVSAANVTPTTQVTANSSTTATSSTTTSANTANTNVTTTTPPSVTTPLPNEEAVNSICEMGFPREEVIRALKASFNNPDRAVEYLTNGIPDDFESEQEGGEGEEGEGEITGISGISAGGNGNNLSATDAVNLADNPLGMLLQSPQFIQLRLVVQQNPRLLGPLLEQISASNPEVFELIKENQEAFMTLIQTPLTENELQVLAADMGSEGDEDEGVTGGEADPTVSIQVTEEEKAAIERLMALGFDRPRVIEAYFACDKNETIAANFLFEHMNDEDF